MLYNMMLITLLLVRVALRGVAMILMMLFNVPLLASMAWPLIVCPGSDFIASATFARHVMRVMRVIDTSPCLPCLPGHASSAVL